VHVLFILWKWTYFHILISKKKRKKSMKCLQENLNGIANHYALPIHMGVSKKHHVSIFFNIHSYIIISASPNKKMLCNIHTCPPTPPPPPNVVYLSKPPLTQYALKTQYMHSRIKTNNIYVGNVNIKISIINFYFIFPPMNGWHMSLLGHAT
jgi:hypothetical protein